MDEFNQMKMKIENDLSDITLTAKKKSEILNRCNDNQRKTKNTNKRAVVFVMLVCVFMIGTSQMNSAMFEYLQSVLGINVLFKNKSDDNLLALTTTVKSESNDLYIKVDMAYISEGTLTISLEGNMSLDEKIYINNQSNKYTMELKNMDYILDKQSNIWKGKAILELPSKMNAFVIAQGELQLPIHLEKSMSVNYSSDNFIVLDNYDIELVPLVEVLDGVLSVRILSDLGDRYSSFEIDSDAIYIEKKDGTVVYPIRGDGDNSFYFEAMNLEGCQVVIRHFQVTDENSGTSLVLELGKDISETVELGDYKVSLVDVKWKQYNEKIKIRRKDGTYESIEPAYQNVTFTFDKDVVNDSNLKLRYVQIQMQGNKNASTLTDGTNVYYADQNKSIEGENQDDKIKIAVDYAESNSPSYIFDLQSPVFRYTRELRMDLHL